MAEKEKKPPKLSTFDDMVRSAEKEFGKGVIQPSANVPALIRLPTGRVMLDHILAGGFPANRMISFWGHKSAGKSTGILIAIREYLKCCSWCLQYLDECLPPCGKKSSEGMVVWIDMEGTYDKEWVATLGIDASRIFVSKPERGEHALDIIDMALRVTEVGFGVVDSLAALTPKAEIEKSHDDSIMADQARLINRGTRKWVSSINFRQLNGMMPLVFITVNQFRMKVGQMFGNPETVPGGMAQTFASSLVLIHRHAGTAKSGKELDKKKVPEFGDADMDKPMITRTRYQVKWSKVSTMGQECEADMFLQDVGDFRVGDILDFSDTMLLAEKWGFLNEGPAGVEFLGDTFSSRTAFRKFLEEDPDRYARLKRRLIRNILSPPEDSEKKAEPAADTPAKAGKKERKDGASV